LYSTPLYGEKKPCELIFVRPLTIPSALSKSEEPFYNFEDYNFELKNIYKLPIQ
jgi:hypothetical protein